MKLSVELLVAFLTFIAVATADENAGYCFSAVSNLCTGTDVKKGAEEETKAQCTGRYGGFKEGKDGEKMVTSATSLVNEHLKASMEYLLLASNYAQWDNNREGFHNFFSKHSDNSWDDAVALIHHLAQRGVTPKLTVQKPLPSDNKGKNFTTASELENLSWALDKEQDLVKTTFALVRSAHEHKDAEFAHFLSEQLSDKHVMRVKTLANHVNTLHKVIHEDKEGKVTGSGVDHSFGIHLYDTQILK